MISRVLLHSRWLAGFLPSVVLGINSSMAYSCIPTFARLNHLIVSTEAIQSLDICQSIWEFNCPIFSGGWSMRCVESKVKVPQILYFRRYQTNVPLHAGHQAAATVQRLVKMVRFGCRCWYRMVCNVQRWRFQDLGKLPPDFDLKTKNSKRFWRQLKSKARLISMDP